GRIQNPPARNAPARPNAGRARGCWGSAPRVAPGPHDVRPTAGGNDSVVPDPASGAPRPATRFRAPPAPGQRRPASGEDAPPPLAPWLPGSSRAVADRRRRIAGWAPAPAAGTPGQRRE